MAKQCENVTILISAAKAVIVLAFTLLGSSSIGGAAVSAWSDNDRARVSSLEMRCAVQLVDTFLQVLPVKVGQMYI